MNASKSKARSVLKVIEDIAQNAAKILSLDTVFEYNLESTEKHPVKFFKDSEDMDHYMKELHYERSDDF